MPFTSEQLAYAGNAAINYFLRNDPIDNVNIARPLIKKLMEEKKPYVGGLQYVVEQLRYSNDSNFQSLAKNTATHCVLAHVRQASSPGIIHLYNNHPFLFGRHVLQHNGAISHFGDIRYKMITEMSPNARAAVSGATDSEHFGR